MLYQDSLEAIFPGIWYNAAVNWS